LRLRPHLPRQPTRPLHLCLPIPPVFSTRVVATRPRLLPPPRPIRPRSLRLQCNTRAIPALCLLPTSLRPFRLPTYQPRFPPTPLRRPQSLLRTRQRLRRPSKPIILIPLPIKTLACPLPSLLSRYSRKAVVTVVETPMA